MKFQRRVEAGWITRLCYIGSLGRPALKIVSRRGVEWLECLHLARAPWVLHAFSTRRGGVSKPPAEGLNLGRIRSDRRANVEANRRLFFEQIGAGSFYHAALRQVHSSKIYEAVRVFSGEVEYRPAGYPETSGGSNLGDQDSARASGGESRIPRHDDLPAGDALLTDQPGILLSVRAADCMPVLIVDPQHRAVAAIHAGWRGAWERILEKAVAEMRCVFGSRPADLLAAVGPSIHACCYEVGEEVVSAYCSRFVRGEKFFRSFHHPPVDLLRRYPALSVSSQPPAETFRAVPAARLDLISVARDQFRSAGLRPANIQVAKFCTGCQRDLFFYHRKEGGATGRMMAVIAVRPERDCRD